jgi:hypothetical protein
MRRAKPPKRESPPRSGKKPGLNDKCSLVFGKRARKNEKNTADRAQIGKKQSKKTGKLQKA